METEAIEPVGALIWMGIGVVGAVCVIMIKELIECWIRWIALDVWEEQIKHEMELRGLFGESKRKTKRI